MASHPVESDRGRRTLDEAFDGSRKVCSIPPFSFPVFGKDTYREVAIGEDVDRRLLVGWREA